MNSHEMPLMLRAQLFNEARSIVRRNNYARHGSDWADDEWLSSLSDDELWRIIDHNTNPNPRFGPQYF